MKLPILRKLLRGSTRSWFPDPKEKDESSRAALCLVALTSAEIEQNVLREAAERQHWEVGFAGSCEEAWRQADRLRAPVILCDRDVPGVAWREAVGILAALPHRPTVVLISQVADEYLWHELFRTGGFDVLRKPLQADEVSRVLKLALSYWQSEAARLRTYSGATEPA